MNDEPEDLRSARQVAQDGDVPEPAMEALLRAELGKPLPLPAGFKERVLARAVTEAGVAGGSLAGLEDGGARPGGAKVLAFPRAAAWRLVAGGALAASVLAGTFGVEMERRHREASRLAHERIVANQQFDEATRITEAALAHTREQLQRAGIFEDRER